MRTHLNPSDDWWTFLVEQQNLWTKVFDSHLKNCSCLSWHIVPYEESRIIHQWQWIYIIWFLDSHWNWRDLERWNFNSFCTCSLWSETCNFHHVNIVRKKLKIKIIIFSAVLVSSSLVLIWTVVITAIWCLYGSNWVSQLRVKTEQVVINWDPNR